MPPLPSFQRALRGYARTEVDALVATVESALESRDSTIRSQAAAMLHTVAFPVQLGGYDRRQVETYLHDVQAQLLSR